MRNTFIKELTKAATYDSNLYLLVGDVGFSVIEEFQKNHWKIFDSDNCSGAKLDRLSLVEMC